MECALLVGYGDGLQIWRIAANVSKKQTLSVAKCLEITVKVAEFFKNKVFNISEVDCEILLL
jgi:hypothetical protein